MAFQSGKSFEKLRHRAFQLYHQSMLEISEIDQVHLRAVMLFMLETSEIVIIFNIHGIWLKSPKSQLSKTFFRLKIC